MRKKVLYITMNKIFENSGGGLGARRIYNSLKSLKSEKNIDFKVISLDNDITESAEFKISKNKNDDIISRLCLHSNYMYTQFKNEQLISEIKVFNPDIVFISSSRLGFVAKKLKKIGIKNIVGFFDNIEYDYVDGYALKFSGIKRNVFKFIEKKVVHRDEKVFINNLDMAIFLTKRDKCRAENLYDIGFKNEKIIPICVNKSSLNLISENNINLVFMGSLSYGSNIDAIEYFIENIWNDIEKKFKNIKFIVAGGNPPETLVYKIQKYENIILKANFKHKEDVVNEKSIIISPIRTGAGMKVKVAEALSMGLPIIGSKETLIGYEELGKEENFVFEANNTCEYVKYISILKKENFRKIKATNLALYNKYYSEDRIKKDIISIIENY